MFGAFFFIVIISIIVRGSEGSLGLHIRCTPNAATYCFRSIITIPLLIYVVIIVVTIRSMIDSWIWTAISSLALLLLLVVPSSLLLLWIPQVKYDDEGVGISQALQSRDGIYIGTFWCRRRIGCEKCSYKKQILFNLVTATTMTMILIPERSLCVPVGNANVHFNNPNHTHR